MVIGITQEYFNGYIISLRDGIDIFSSDEKWGDIMDQIKNNYENLDNIDQNFYNKIRGFILKNNLDKSREIYNVLTLSALIREKLSLFPGLIFEIKNVYVGEIEPKFYYKECNFEYDSYILIYWDGCGPYYNYRSTNEKQNISMKEALNKLNLNGDIRKHCISSTY